MCRASEALSTERTAFEAEKREHYQLYERQQQVGYILNGGSYREFCKPSSVVVWTDLFGLLRLIVCVWPVGQYRFPY